MSNYTKKRFSEEMKTRALQILRERDVSEDDILGILNDLTCDADIDEMFEAIEMFDEGLFPDEEYLSVLLNKWSMGTRAEYEEQGFDYDNTPW